MHSISIRAGAVLMAIAVLAAVPGTASAQLNGLLGHYYTYTGGYLEDFTFSDPGYEFQFSRVDEDITFGYSEEHYAENNSNGIGFDWEPFGPKAAAFGVHWTGAITVPEGQELFLGIEADDGAYVFLEDQLAIDDGGQHYPTFAWTDDALSTGVYTIDIYLFCNDLIPPKNKSGIDLWWSPKPGIVDDSEWVPSGALDPGLDPVPEPATVALLLMGLGSGALRLKRRRKQI